MLVAGLWLALVPAASAMPASVSLATDDTTLSPIAMVARGAQRTIAVGALQRAYVRFTVTSTAGIPVQRAVLRLWTVDGTRASTSVRSASPSWSEARITQPTVPEPAGVTLATLPAARAGRWAEYDVTRALAGDGTYAFVVGGVSLDGARFAAREAGAATAPQLVVTPMTPPQEIGAYVGDPARATAHRYGATDDRGVSLDGLKAIAMPRGRGYLGVSHAFARGVFRTQVVTSTDLMSWRHVRDLADHASQPTIAALADGSLLVAYERDVADPDPAVVNRSSLVVQRYADAGALVGGAAPVQEVAPARTLSQWSEGTPSIRRATLSPDGKRSEIVVDLHYLRAGSGGRQDVDRQGTAVLRNFRHWSASALPALDAQFDALGVHGNLGDRDDATFRGVPVRLFEGQARRRDFSTFRIYRNGAAGDPPIPVAIRTEGGSTAFGNPTLSVLRSPSGRLAVFSTAFVFAEGAARGEAGALLMLREVADAPRQPRGGRAGRRVGRWRPSPRTAFGGPAGVQHVRRAGST